MMKTCPICGTRRVIMWPEHWIYRRGETYYCSENCMQVDITRDMQLIKSIAHERAKKKGRKGIMGKLEMAQRARAVDMALRGESPIAYLKECGCANPSSSWCAIKMGLKKTNPETWAVLPKDFRKGNGQKKEQIETPEAGIIHGSPEKVLPKIETPEANKVQVVETPEKPKQIYNPVKYDGMVIREVEGLFGRYRRSDVGSAVYIDFEAKDVEDTLSFTVEQWRSFGKEFVKCARILGVEL